MTTIVTRAGKGAPLSNAEVDQNFSGLNTDKLELGGTFSSGTANSILYLNGSKVLTTGSALTFDGTRLAVNGGANGSQFSVKGTSAFVGFDTGAANDGRLEFAYNGTKIFEQEMSSSSLMTLKGTSGVSLSFGANNTEQMRLTSTGLGIGTSSPGAKVHAYDTSNSKILSQTTTGYAQFQASSTSGDFHIVIDNSTGAGFGSGAYARLLYSTGAYPLVFSTNATERMRLDSSGNLGLGVTPSASGGTYGGSQMRTLTVQSANVVSAAGYDAHFAQNAYRLSDGSWRYQGNGGNNVAHLYSQATGGSHIWYTAPSGTAGDAISFSQVMTLDASGNLGVGETSPGSYSKFVVRGGSGNFISYFGASTQTILGDNAGDKGQVGTVSNHPFIFITNATERARITSGGTFETSLDASIYGVTVGRGAGAVSTNTAVGASALAANTTGSINTAVGYAALTVNTTGINNAGFGNQALTSNTTGSSNAAFGYASLFLNTTGGSNTAMGVGALLSNTTASNNTAVGYQAGYSNTTGNPNAFFGQAAGYSNTSGSNNTYLGQGAGYGNQTGSGNVAVGLTALNSATGDTNTAVGFRAGYSQTSGASNTYIGQFAGYSMTTGAKNTIIGAYNGNQGGLDIRTASNYIVLSDGDGNPRGVFDGNGNYFVGAYTLGADANYFATSPGNAFTDFGHGTGVASGVSYQRFLYAGSVVGSVAQSGTGSVAYNTLGTPANGAQLNQTGITFPATQNASSNANTLDDYEQGTFTPTLGGTWTTSPTGLGGTYVKIGRQVYVRVYFDGPAAKNTSTSGWIDSLPFTVVVEGTGSGVDSNVDNKGNVLFANTSRMWLTDTSFAAGANYFSGTYLAAD